LICHPEQIHSAKAHFILEGTSQHPAQIAVRHIPLKSPSGISRSNRRPAHPAQIAVLGGPVS